MIIRRALYARNMCLIIDENRNREGRLRNDGATFIPQRVWRSLVNVRKSEVQDRMNKGL